MTMRCVLLLALLPALMLPATAQEKIVPPPRTGVSVDSVSPSGEEKLPVIDLPDFQITGDDRPALPSVGKSDADTAAPQPMVETRSAGGREPLTSGVGGPEKESVVTGGPPGGNGRLTAGYGSFNTPFFDGWYGRTLDNGDVLIKAGYTVSDGHTAFADHRKGFAGISGGWTFGQDADPVAGMHADLDVTLRGESYRFYGSPTPEQRRTVNRFRAGAELQAAGGGPLEYSGRIRLQGVTMSDEVRTRQTSLGLGFSARRQEGSVLIRGDADLWLESLRALRSSSAPVFFRLAADGTMPLEPHWSLRAGLGLVLFRGSDGDGRSRLAPLVAVSWYPQSGVTVFAGFESSVERRTYETLLDRNPYVSDDALLRHEETPVLLTAGVAVDVIPELTSRLALEYRRVRSALLYLDEDRDGRWLPEYGGLTRILALSWEVRAELGERQSAVSTVTLQGGRNTLTGASPTALPSVTVGGRYAYRFPFGLTAAADLQFLSRRTVDRAGTRFLPGFVLLDLSAEYRILPALSVRGALENLFNPPCVWWEGYRAQPRGVVASLSHSW